MERSAQVARARRRALQLQQQPRVGDFLGGTPTLLQATVVRLLFSTFRSSTYIHCIVSCYSGFSMGVKVPHIVAMAKRALADGHCVVIGLQSTGEASLDFEVTSSQPAKRQTLMRSPPATATASSDVSGDGFVSICREILRRFIQQHFPTRVEQPQVSVADVRAAEERS